MTPALAAVIAYLGAQVAIGVWISRRISTESDYLVAGRRLGYTLATFSIFATWFGAETTVGSAALAYNEGLTLASAEPFGYGLCLVVMGLVFAAPLRRRGFTTLADLYRERYSWRVERVAAVILVPGSVLWAAAQVRAFAHVLATTTPALDLDAALIVAAGFTVLYTMFGGLLVDAVADLIQGAIIVCGLGVLLWAVTRHLGGAHELLVAMRQTGRIRLAAAPPTSPLETIETWAIPVLGSVLATELVGRVLAARTPTVARRSSVLAGGMYLTVGLVPVIVGIVGVRIAPGLADPEQLLPHVARQLLPTFGYVVFAGALISAILSTVDSTLLTASGLLSHNLLVPLLRIERERVKVLLARAGVLTFGVTAYVLAERSEGVFALVEQASAFGSAGVVVTVVFGLFTRFGGPTTAVTTLVSATLGYLVASYGGSPYPFLISLGVAVGWYAVGSAVEAVVTRRS